MREHIEWSRRRFRVTQGVLSIMVGRKRKMGKRYPSGELVREKAKVIDIAIDHPERQGIPASMRHDQRAGNLLGRLNLRSIITNEQAEAGRLYAQEVRRYQQAIGCPSPNAKAMDPSRVSGGGIILTAEEIRQRSESYNEAFIAVNDAGHRSARAVARVAVYDQALPDHCTMDDLFRGLTALEHHYGLTANRKSRYSGNRN